MTEKEPFIIAESRHVDAFTYLFQSKTSNFSPSSIAQNLKMRTNVHLIYLLGMFVILFLAFSSTSVLALPLKLASTHDQQQVAPISDTIDEFNSNEQSVFMEPQYPRYDSFVFTNPFAQQDQQMQKRRFAMGMPSEFLT